MWYYSQQCVWFWSWWKVFFCALNYHGNWADSSLRARFLPHVRKRISNFKQCAGMDFQGVLWLSTFWLHRITSAQHGNFILISVIICCVCSYITSADQKWGMHGFQGSFPWWKKHMQSNGPKKKTCAWINCIYSQLLSWIGGVKLSQNCVWSRVWAVCKPWRIWPISQYCLCPEDFDSDNDSRAKNKNSVDFLSVYYQ